MPTERLQKVLARAGVASRRRAEELIAAGRVRVNGERAGLGSSADPAVDRIELDGELLPAPRAALHYAVHKPRGFVSSVHDERGRRSVVRLVSIAPGARLWPAGRLDADSEGLMLLTNDGEWANRVLHPRYGTEREYAALVDAAPDRDTIRRLLAGVELEDGPAHLLAARRAEPPPEIERERRESGTWLRVLIGEGRKREVRRLFDAVGHHVLRLVRTRLGPVTLRGLAPGASRPLTADEVAELAGDRPWAR